MGKSFSQLIDDTTNDSKKNTLLQLEKELNDRRECQTARLYIGALNDECIPIVCAVDKFHGILGGLSLSGTSDDTVLKTEIGNIIRKHLRGSDSESFDTLNKLLLEVVKANLESQTETHEENHTHVVYANKNFIRIDYFLYSKKLDSEHVLFYYMQVGLIDIKRVRWPVLLYELRRATDDDKLKDGKGADKELEVLKDLGDLRLDSAKNALEYLNNLK